MLELVRHGLRQWRTGRERRPGGGAPGAGGGVRRREQLSSGPGTVQGVASSDPAQPGGVGRSRGARATGGGAPASSGSSAALRPSRGPAAPGPSGRGAGRSRRGWSAAGTRALSSQTCSRTVLVFLADEPAKWPRLLGNAVPRDMRTASDSARARGVLGPPPAAPGGSGLRLRLESGKGPVQRYLLYPDFLQISLPLL
ncbi:spidroin-2-like isoform X2 [Serinus canaria]|uniref:spidroin-2-like isoform X2 n=1 Tax=Serinus canaria TaxID=9135 RepID=UPI0021CC8581|nr:spidroin-2-like isoform X2 [Serinus canaria]